jgi:hypothetical protein
VTLQFRIVASRPQAAQGEAYSQVWEIWGQPKRSTNKFTHLAGFAIKSGLGDTPIPRAAPWQYTLHGTGELRRIAAR